ncbi:cob(I)yrinic acid a,c-diamide adenosyltransferase [Tindallia californiensis]|uniref:Cob(I)alamin adenosyltransferase n=1 Tax=Tindallia californiensis TaxID=159292 RepID=A0A1H3R352_9FIRM|nr:cob(I)yrinic acid a,c-diamide adenosyltransferase [Tindallia californiensis]SDZ19735.1 cob(I)alamin adenosyltransferase [Tindallia californiensis]
MPEKGYVQVYTGNGKGKTTAALGLSLRAVCSGKKVYVGQFIKGMAYSEMKAPSLLEGITIEQYGRDCFIKNDPTEEDVLIAKKGLDTAREIIRNKTYDVVVLDELNVALYYKLVSIDKVLDLIAAKPASTELIITGRYAPAELLEVADLVTEMKEVKHYYQQGVKARKGIEN